MNTLPKYCCHTIYESILYNTFKTLMQQMIIGIVQLQRQLNGFNLSNDAALLNVMNVLIFSCISIYDIILSCVVQYISDFYATNDYWNCSTVKTTKWFQHLKWCCFVYFHKWKNYIFLVAFTNVTFILYNFRWNRDWQVDFDGHLVQQ